MSELECTCINCPRHRREAPRKRNTAIIWDSAAKIQPTLPSRNSNGRALRREMSLENSCWEHMPDEGTDQMFVPLGFRDASTTPSYIDPVTFLQEFNPEID